MDYVNRLQESRAAAEALLNQIKKTESPSREELRVLVDRYAKTRFMTEDLTETEDIAALAAESIARIYKIPQEKLLETDKPSGCTYATSVADKKILLILSISKALGVRLKPEKSTKIRTLTQLSDELYEALKEKA